MDNELIKMFNRKQLPENAVFSHLNKNIGVGSNGISLPVLSKVSFAEMTTYMQNVLLRDTDQMSMAHSLEVRVPFLDHELVEYVFAVPDAVKYPNYAKQLLVESVGDLLPPEIVHRPKMGFTLPWEQWMKGELKSFCEDRIAKFAKREEVKEDYIMRNWDSFLSDSKSIKWSKIWYLIVLENWLTENEIE
jgi:asparagine synthase (glutamine-hydrolysing)